MKLASLSYDLHRLQPGKGLRIGGVPLEVPLSFIAHSDGDPLLHSLIDSLLGSVNFRGDIGTLFPETPEWKGADSLKLLRLTKEIVNRALGHWFVKSLQSILVTTEDRLFSALERNLNAIADLLAEELKVEELEVGLAHSLGLPPLEDREIPYVQALTQLSLERGEPSSSRARKRVLVSKKSALSLLRGNHMIKDLTFHEGQDKLELILKAMKSLLSRARESFKSCKRIDLTLIFQVPKLAPHREMLESLVKEWGFRDFSLKFRTNEGVGDVGRGMRGVIIALLT